MRILKTSIFLAGLLLLSGCIRSLHPFYNEGDIIFDSNLIGRWAEDDSRDTWEFSKEGDKEYKLVYTDEEGKQGTFEVHLFKVRGKMFMDLFPVELDLDQNDYYQFHILPVHSLAFIKQIEPTLQMSFPDPDWLKKLLSKNPNAIRHEKIDDEIVLTASTAELQQFWRKHLDTEGVFDDLSNMKRRESVTE